VESFWNNLFCNVLFFVIDINLHICFKTKKSKLKKQYFQYEIWIQLASFCLISISKQKMVYKSRIFLYFLLYNSQNHQNHFVFLHQKSKKVRKKCQRCKTTAYRTEIFEKFVIIRTNLRLEIVETFVYNFFVEKIKN